MEKEDWVVRIEADIQKQSETKQNSKSVMRRVRRQLKKLKPEHYVAEEFSFGLFDRFPADVPHMAAHKCRVVLASAFCEVVKKSWRELCDLVVPKPAEILGRYDDLLDSDILKPEEIQSVFTFDAVFLTSFLGSISSEKFKTSWPAISSVIDSNFIFITMFNPLMRDLFKVENQFPIVLLEKVLGLLVERLQVSEEGLVDEIMRTICERSLTVLSERLPGWSLSAIERSLDGPKPIIKDIPFKRCKNFLECMHRMIFIGTGSREPGAEDGTQSDFVHSLSRNILSSRMSFRSHQGPEDGAVSAWVNQAQLTFQEFSLPSVTELKKAGIKFVGRKGQSVSVEFKPSWDPFSATLYLPTLKINDDTEMLWRNLVASEDQLNAWDQDYELDFTPYLEFMDQLIDSPEDVEVLKTGWKPVIIDDALGTNEVVALLFNNTVLQNCARGQRNYKYKLVYEQIYAFYNVKWRRTLLEWWKKYFGKPWTSLSLFVAIGLLVMTTLQTYYNVRSHIGHG